jgi:hypothetical protein
MILQKVETITNYELRRTFRSEDKIYYNEDTLPCR